jgi:hypothetical protein
MASTKARAPALVDTLDVDRVMADLVERIAADG